ncbi:MAG: hypothetical protein AAGG68_08520 [Bacteroidota bacterium]
MYKYKSLQQGVSRFQRTDDVTKYWMRVLSGLCSYRSTAKILSGLGFWSYAYGNFRHSVSWVSERVYLGLSQMQPCLLLVDGTGISTFLLLNYSLPKVP